MHDIAWAGDRTNCPKPNHSAGVVSQTALLEYIPAKCGAENERFAKGVAMLLTLAIIWFEKGICQEDGWTDY